MYSLACGSILGLLFCLGPARGFAQMAKPVTALGVVSVCEVFTNLDTYTGKIVEVRGHLRYGREWSAVGDPSCPSQFPGSPKDWPRLIVLVFNPSETHSPADSRIDRSEVDRALKILSFMQYGTPEQLGVDVTLIVTGEFRSIRSPKETRGLPNIAGDGPGFGHLGAFPAEILCQKIKDIVIRQVR